MSGHKGALAGFVLAALVAGIPSAVAQTPDVIDPVAAFIDEERYIPVKAEKLDSLLVAGLTADTDSVFRPGGDLSAPVRAVLVLQAADGTLPRSRIQILVGMEPVEMPPAAAPVPVSFIEINRYNLGPAIRAELVESLSEQNVAPAETFGVGPHVSWRMVMQPEMGTAAMLVAAARAELGEADARARSCLGVSCLAPAGAIERAAPWGEMAETGSSLDVPFETVRDGLPTPAAALAHLLAGMDLAPRPRRGGEDAFFAAVIETGLGQDLSLEAGLVERDLMDDSVAAIWKRLAAFPQDLNGGPMMFRAEAFECARGDAGFAAPGGYCP